MHYPLSNTYVIILVMIKPKKQYVAMHLITVIIKFYIQKLAMYLCVCSGSF